MIVELDFKTVDEAFDEDYLYNGEPCLFLIEGRIYEGCYERGHGQFYLYDGLYVGDEHIQYLFPYGSDNDNHGIHIDGIAPARVV